jgi:dipeptidyl aminopeptidase/acylaminoacyl peptidase
MTRYFLLCLLLIAGYGGRCGAGASVDALTRDVVRVDTLRRDTLSIEKALFRRNIGRPVLSLDGKKAVVTVSVSGAPADSLAMHIWLLDLQTKTFRQFTNSTKSESAPKWSPDGRQLAFASARGGSSQIYLIDMQGGEAMPLTNSKSDIGLFEWAPDGKSIVYVCQDELSDSLKKRRDAKFDENVVGESDRPSTIYRIDVATRAARPILRHNWRVGEMRWLPSGDAMLLLVHPLPEEEMPLPKLIRFNLVDSSVKELATPQHAFFGGFQLSPDGKIAAFAGARADGPTTHDLFIHRLDDNAYVNITDKSLDRIVTGYKFTDDHRLLGLVQRGFDYNLYAINDDGSAKPFGPKCNMQSFDVAANGTLVYVGEDYTHLPELYVIQPGGVPEKVSDINRSLAGISLVTPKIFTYKTFDGLSIEAALYLPAGGTTQAKVPLVALIHGGPTGAFPNVYVAWAQLLVQAGYAVFCPNIRGSTGYGWDFVVANRKDWGGNDYKDMMAGIDYLIKNERIDPDRLGICGWSYGGYMAEWAITQTKRFKASVTGAGMANLASEFGTESGAYYDQWFWGVPYENLDLFIKHSPIAYLKNVSTPTLIIQGEEDGTDPKGQSQELYRGLHYYHVPSELVLYPREPHGFRELNHNVDFYRRMLDWFKRYL